MSHKCFRNQKTKIFATFKATKVVHKDLTENVTREMEGDHIGWCSNGSVLEEIGCLCKTREKLFGEKD